MCDLSHVSLFQEKTYSNSKHLSRPNNLSRVWCASRLLLEEGKMFAPSCFGILCSKSSISWRGSMSDDVSGFGLAGIQLFVYCFGQGR
jgi:hypothetical protein